MTTTTTIATSSTNIESAVTIATTTTLPKQVLDLPQDQRDNAASSLLVKDNQSLQNVVDHVLSAIGLLIQGEQESTVVKDGPNINFIFMTAPNQRVYLQSEDRSTNCYLPRSW